MQELMRANGNTRPARVGMACSDRIYRQLEIAAERLGTTKSSLLLDIAQSFLAAQEDLPDLPITVQLFHAAAESKQFSANTKSSVLKDHLTDHLIDALYTVRHRRSA